MSALRSVPGVVGLEAGLRRPSSPSRYPFPKTGVVNAERLLVTTRVACREPRPGERDGYVDPDASLPPATAGDPVPWAEFVDEVRTAILRDRTFPSTSRSDIGYTDLQIANDTPAASDYGDYYRRDMDIILNGYESL